MGHFTFWVSPFAQRNHYVYSQASRSKFILIIVGTYMSSSTCCYYTKEKGMVQISSLQTSNRVSFAKMSRLDVCELIRLHNSFLLKYNNNNKYLKICKYPL